MGNYLAARKLQRNTEREDMITSCFCKIVRLDRWIDDDVAIVESINGDIVMKAKFKPSGRILFEVLSIADHPIEEFNKTKIKKNFWYDPYENRGEGCDWLLHKVCTYRHFFLEGEELQSAIDKTKEDFMTHYCSEFEKIGKYQFSYLGSIFEIGYGRYEETKQIYANPYLVKVKISNQYYKVDDIENRWLNFHLYDGIDVRREKIDALLAKVVNYHHLIGLKPSDS